MKPGLAFALLVASTLVVTGCASKNTVGDGAASKTITIKDDFYDPRSFNAAGGELVQWKNVAKGTHTVTVQEPGGAKGEYLYSKELIGPGGTAEFTFPSPGTYDVFCLYHSQGAQGNFSAGMVMRIVVT